MLGQLPVPVSSRVHVTGSPTSAVSGTTREVSWKSPTAPVKLAGEGEGKGCTTKRGESLVMAYCSARRDWRNPAVGIPMFTSCCTEGMT